MEPFTTVKPAKKTPGKIFSRYFQEQRLRLCLNLRAVSLFRALHDVTESFVDKTLSMFRRISKVRQIQGGPGWTMVRMVIIFE